VFVALSALLLPKAALACPYCAGRPSGGMAETLALFALLLLPFALAGLVFRAERAAARRAAAAEAKVWSEAQRGG